MTRTQIQLPDDVYDRARKVCKSREISLTELVRRGLEYILSVYATHTRHRRLLAAAQAPPPRLEGPERR